MTLTADELRAVVHYDPDTGIFTWLPRPDDKRFTTRYAGTRAGKVAENGRRQISVYGKLYYAHRLAWLHFYGEWPSGDLDHRDVEPDYNWIGNLRPANKSGNGANTHAYASSKTGLKGASFDRRTGKFRAQIKVDGRVHWLGGFATADEAHEQYVAAAKQHHGEFARAA